MTLRFNKDKGVIELQPSPSDFVDQLVELVADLVAQLRKLPCLEADKDKTGYARQS